MNKKSFCFFFLFCFAASMVAGQPDDWSQWRGPMRNGLAQNFKFSKSLPSELKSIWSIEVGTGHSSPVIADRIVYLFSREGESEVARAIDLNSGKALWRTEYSAPYKEYPGAIEHGKGPKSTPVVHSGKLFTFGITGILSSFSAKDGKLLWQKQFAGRFPATAPPFGTSMSPLIEDGILIVHAGGHDGGALLAMDPNTGKEKWSLVGEGPSYSSPIVVTTGQEKQIVIQVHRKILGIGLHSGKALWNIPFVTPCDQNIVTPLIAGNLLIFSSLDHGIFAVRLNKNKETWNPEIVWETKDVSLYMSSPILVRDRLMGFSHKKRGQFFAMDAQTGKLLWTSAGDAGENAALVVTENHLLILKEDAELLVLPVEAESFAPVATYQVASSETWAHPVPTSQGILIKDATKLSLLVQHFGARASLPAVKE